MQYCPELFAIRGVIEDSGLRGKHRHGDSSAAYAVVHYSHISVHSIGCLPWHLEVDLLLSVHIIDRKKGRRLTIHEQRIRQERVGQRERWREIDAARGG